MKDTVFYFSLLALAIFIYITEGASLNLFTLWNTLPLLLSLILYKADSKGKLHASTNGAWGFLIGSMMLSGYLHLAWYFNWQEIKTNSSTAGLIFIFIPIYALIPGIIGYFIGRNITFKN